MGTWLLEASRWQRPLDVSLLLAAGLHRDVLLDEPDVSSLAEFYPSVGGLRPAGEMVESGWLIDHGFKRALFESIAARSDALHRFVKLNQVQTNETGRGLAWLLPISLAGWPRIHLLDLGASAGLNLAGDWRHYQILARQDNRQLLSLGRGQPVQFEIRAGGDNNGLKEHQVGLPDVISRIGLDLRPFELKSTQDVAKLTSFVWADQSARLERLKEGISAFEYGEIR